MDVKEGMKKAGCGRMCECWFENGRCTLPIKVECWYKSDCLWVEVNLATLKCWGYYQILNIGVSLITWSSPNFASQALMYIVK